MFCPNCGCEVKDDAKFCPNCGSDLKNVNNQSSSANIKPKSGGISGFFDDWKEWGTGKKIGSIILACCVGLLILGAIGSVMFPDANTSGSDNTYHSDNVERQDVDTGSSSSSSQVSDRDDDELGDSKLQVRIKCKGGWDGSVGVGTSTSSYSGKGDKIINLDGSSSDIVAAVIQKKSSGNGKLKVEIIKDGRVVKEADTTAGYGVVSVAD